MQRKEQKDKSASDDIEKYKAAKIVKHKEAWTLYDALFPKGPICQYKEVQANATAKWWLKTLKEDVPQIVSLLSDKQKEVIQLTREQEENFIKTLTDLIWLECQNPEHQLGETYLRIDYNGQNWDLVKKAMQAINFSIKGDEVINFQWGSGMGMGILSQIQQDGKAIFAIGSKYGDIYNPDNAPSRIIDTENHSPPKLR